MSEFIVIEKVVNESEDHIDGHLLTRKAFWCSQLCTLRPHGLNDQNLIKKIELGSDDKSYEILAIFFLSIFRYCLIYSFLDF